MADKCKFKSEKCNFIPEKSEQLKAEHGYLQVFTALILGFTFLSTFKEFSDGFRWFNVSNDQWLSGAHFVLFLLILARYYGGTHRLSTLTCYKEDVRKFTYGSNFLKIFFLFVVYLSLYLAGASVGNLELFFGALVALHLSSILGLVIIPEPQKGTGEKKEGFENRENFEKAVKSNFIVLNFASLIAIMALKFTYCICFWNSTYKTTVTLLLIGIYGSISAIDIFINRKFYFKIENQSTFFLLKRETAPPKVLPKKSRG